MITKVRTSPGRRNNWISVELNLEILRKWRWFEIRTIDTIVKFLNNFNIPFYKIYAIYEMYENE